MADVIDQIGGAANVLLEMPSMGGSRDLCTSLLTVGVDQPSVLFVSYVRQADACVDQVEASGVDTPQVGVLTVGESAAATDRDDIVTENVSSASDLTGLGIQIGKFLSEWEGPVVVCFDSITSMLQYVDFETAYEFLHAITGQIKAADARAHFHIDPAAHDRKVVDGIKTLCDASITVDDGDPTVRTRDLIER